MLDNPDDFFDEDLALSVLLKDGVLFCNTRHYSMHKDGKSEGETIVLYVLCNDVFCYGADAEDIRADEIKGLYNLWINTKNKWGMVIWCAIKRNVRPLNKFVNLMEKDGVWTDIMESLPLNTG